MRAIPILCFCIFVRYLTKRLLFKLDDNKTKAIQDGNRKAILELYRNTFQLLMGNAVRYTNDQEKQMQIVNNTFLKIITNIAKFEIGTAYFSWAKQIVHRVIIDDFRSSKRYNELFLLVDEYNDNHFVDNNEQDVDCFEEGELQHILDKLPPATKMVFNLYAIDEYSYNDIMEELNITYETVKWHLKEARKKLRVEIKENKIIQKVNG